MLDEYFPREEKQRVFTTARDEEKEETARAMLAAVSTLRWAHQVMWHATELGDVDVSKFRDCSEHCRVRAEQLERRVSKL